MLRVIKQAPKLDPEPLPIAIRACLLRATAITATRKAQREAAA